MRLNFSGVGEDDIREGVRRIGKVISEQVALYGTLTGAKPAPRRGSEAAADEPGRVVPLRRREAS
jgi:2-aminoadipate transaminase